MLVAAILISGLSYARFQEALSIANIKLFSERTFYRYLQYEVERYIAAIERRL